MKPVHDRNTTTMRSLVIEKAAAQFGKGEQEIEPLGEGLIHRTYKVTYHGTDRPIVLQCLNQTTFPQPENIINNYRIISQYLKFQPNSVQVPAMVLTLSGKLFWIDGDGNFWRATSFMKNAYTQKESI